MNERVTELARVFADRQREFFEISRRLDESNMRFIRSHPDDYAATNAHALVWKESISAGRVLEKAARDMQRAAGDEANLPTDHPLWQWLEH